MARWFKFSHDFPYRHPSRAVTAYKAGMIQFLPDKITEAAIAAKKGDYTEKPEGRDGRLYVTDKPHKASDAEVKQSDADFVPVGDGLIEND